MSKERVGWGAPPPVDAGRKNALVAWLMEVRTKAPDWAWREYGSRTSASSMVNVVKRLAKTHMSKDGGEVCRRGNRIYVRFVGVKP